jgi:chromosome segregation ATPase
LTAIEDEIREKSDHANGRLGALFAQLRDALAERGRRLSEAAERLRKSMADKAFAKKPLPDKLATLTSVAEELPQLETELNAATDEASRAGVEWSWLTAEQLAELASKAAALRTAAEKEQAEKDAKAAEVARLRDALNGLTAQLDAEMSAHADDKYPTLSLRERMELLKRSTDVVGKVEADARELEPQTKAFASELPELGALAASMKNAQKTLAKRRKDAEKELKKQTAQLRANEAALRKQLDESRRELEATASQPLDGRLAKLRQLVDVVGAGGALRASVEAVRNESNALGVELETSPEEALAALEADVARALAAAEEEARRLADERERASAELGAAIDELRRRLHEQVAKERADSEAAPDVFAQLRALQVCRWSVLVNLKTTRIVNELVVFYLI